MKHPHFIEQNHSDAASFALADVGTHFNEHRLNVAPLHVAAGRPSEDQFKRALVPAPHGKWYQF